VILFILTRGFPSAKYVLSSSLTSRFFLFLFSFSLFLNSERVFFIFGTCPFCRPARLLTIYAFFDSQPQLVVFEPLILFFWLTILSPHPTQGNGSVGSDHSSRGTEDPQPFPLFLALALGPSRCSLSGRGRPSSHSVILNVDINILMDIFSSETTWDPTRSTATRH